MEEFFDSERFDITRHEDYYIISTKDGKQCLTLSLDEDTIEVHDLDKCGLTGTILLDLLEKYARSVGIKEINLLDASLIHTNCEDETGQTINIDLAVLKLLTTGKSWYNSLGYFSSDDTEETKEEIEKIANLPCIDAILSCKETEIRIINTLYDIGHLERIKASAFPRSQLFIDTEYDIENNADIIESKIDEVKYKTRMIVTSSGRLFPHADLKLSVRDYLKTILPKKFVKEGNCREYGFIEKFINFISVLLDYNSDLTKTLATGRRKKRRKTRRKTRNKRKNSSRKTKH